MSQEAKKIKKKIRK
uniref:Uncharacterized protein n=1 Tax=Rhizophora mucronata TaxID=61149 RepID=A0A2P2QK57_RHIMU